MKFGIFTALLFILLCSELTFSQSIRHTYRFYEDLSVAKPECGPDLTPAVSAKPGGVSCATTQKGGEYVEDRLPCGVLRKVYQNNLHWGLTYPNAEGTVAANYTIQMYVKVKDWGSTWTRIIDFSNGTRDEGIYFKSNPGSNDRCLNFYPSGIAGECPYFNQSTYYLLTFTRNGQTGMMDVYVDNTLFTSYDDSEGKYVGKAGTPIYIFRDDEQKTCESGSANFAYMSFSNKYFSQTQVDSTFKDICFLANINAYADFSISPNPSCGFPKNIEIKYTGIIPAPGTGYTFEWDWDGARVISGSGMGPYIVSWDTGGSKNVALTVKSVGCGNSLYNRKQAVISSLEMTSTVISGDCQTGANGSFTLQGSGGQEPYQYSIDSVNYQTSPNFAVPVGKYRAYAKDKNGCTVGRDVEVEFQGDITVSAMADTLVCFGDNVNLNTEGNGQRYVWSPPAGLDDPNSKSPVASPETTTTYVVTAYKGECSQKDTVVVTVAPKVEVNVTPDTIVNMNVPFQLIASSPQVKDLNNALFRWSPPEGLNYPNSPSPTALLRDDQTYTIEITSPEGCKGTGTVNLKIKRPESISIPTAFTPNGDGKNDELLPILSQISSISYFKIYNRWGQLIFYTTQLNAGWDGRYKNAEPIVGTYVWEIEGTSVEGKIIRKNGSVMLIK